MSKKIIRNVKQIRYIQEKKVIRPLKKIYNHAKFHKSMEYVDENEKEEISTVTKSKSKSKSPKTKSSFILRNLRKERSNKDNQEEEEIESDRNENDPKNRQRRRLIIATAVSIGIFVLTIVFIVISLVSRNGKATTPIATNKLPITTTFMMKTTKILKTTKSLNLIPDTNLTGLCQETHPCLYFKEKYVPSDECNQTKCDSLFLEPLIPTAHRYEQLEFKPYFFKNGDQKRLRFLINVPKGTLCKHGDNYGFCSRGQCVLDKKITNANVEAIKPINGGWSKFSSLTKDNACVFYTQGLTTEQLKTWDELTIQTKCDSSSCKVWRIYEFRMCNCPAPAFGGKLCWQHPTATVQWYEWPLRFSAPCPHCRNPYNGDRCVETDLSGEVNCMEKYILSTSVLARNNEYCCQPKMEPQHGRFPGYGQCIARFCFPVHFKE